MEEQLASQELARKDEGLKLRVQLHTATQEVREVQIKVSALVRKLVTAQQGVTSQRASMGRKMMEILKLETEGTRKREELRAPEHLVREALKLDQAARAKEVKSKQIAKTDVLAKEKAEKELTAKKAREKSRQAEEARRAEADRKAEADRLSWREVSPHGVTPKKKAGPYHCPRAVGMRLVSRDEIPTNSTGYR